MFTRNWVGFRLALVLTSVAVAAASVHAQTPPLTQSSPNDLETELAALKADNAAIREQLRKLEEQQKALLELLDRLQPKAAVAAAPAGPATSPAASSGEAQAPPPLSARI